MTNLPIALYYTSKGKKPLDKPDNDDTKKDFTIPAIADETLADNENDETNI